MNPPTYLDWYLNIGIFLFYVPLLIYRIWQDKSVVNIASTIFLAAPIILIYPVLTLCVISVAIKKIVKI